MKLTQAMQKQLAEQFKILLEQYRYHLDKWGRFGYREDYDAAEFIYNYVNEKLNLIIKKV